MNQPTLFAITLPEDNRVERLRVMHRMYGVNPDHRCGTCAHLRVKHYAGTYYKCGLNTDTGGAASDWRVGWQACGRYTEERETDG